MATDDNAATPKPKPLDALRAKLREEGHSESATEQILINRASGSSWPQAQATGVGVGVGGQGVLAGVLANLGALLAHARNALPALLLDFKNTFDRSAAPSARGKALGSLLVKLAIVGVLGYAVKQEFLQHIIYGPQTAAEQVKLTTFQAEQAAAAVTNTEEDAENCAKSGANKAVIPMTH